MNNSRVYILVAALLLFGLSFGPHVVSRACAQTFTASDHVLTGELVVIKGSRNQFRLVGHGGSFTAPAGTAVEALDGKPVQVEIGRDGRVLQISEMPIQIERTVHGYEVITGQLELRDAAARTFTITGNDRLYVAPSSMDLRPYADRMVEVRLDEQGRVRDIHFTPGSAAPVALPLTSTCSYSGQSYSDGAGLCQSGMQYRCDRGTWLGLGTACAADNTTAVRSRSCMVGGASVANGSSICRSGTTFRCTDGEWVNVGAACS